MRATASRRVPVTTPPIIPPTDDSELLPPDPAQYRMEPQYSGHSVRQPPSSSSTSE